MGSGGFETQPGTLGTGGFEIQGGISGDGVCEITAGSGLLILIGGVIEVGGAEVPKLWPLLIEGTPPNETPDPPPNQFGRVGSDTVGKDGRDGVGNEDVGNEGRDGVGKEGRDGVGRDGREGALPPVICDTVGTDKPSRNKPFPRNPSGPGIAAAAVLLVFT